MSEPLLTLKPPDANAPKASVYALATDPFGKTIASGSPERVIRLWDPRTGKRTGKLVGHTDNIRTILLSEDARYVSITSFFYTFFFVPLFRPTLFCLQIYDEFVASFLQDLLMVSSYYRNPLGF
jgi:WD40 repeat protein